MHPIMFKIFGFPIYSYGVMLLTSFAVSIGVCVLINRRDGNSAAALMEVALWGILGGLVGGRLGYVIQNLPYYFARPLSILNVREGGMTVITGVILGAVAIILAGRRPGVPVMNLLDVFCGPPLLVGMAIGRIGCLLHGCCYGKLCPPSWRPWSITYPPGVLGAGVPSGPRYPVPIMELSLDLILCLIILLFLRPRVRFAGQIFWATFGGYAVIRFCTEFYRAGSTLGPLTLAQWTSILFALIAGLGFMGYYGKPRIVKNLQLDPDVSAATRP